MGRRRPFILGLSILALIGLTFQTFALDIRSIFPESVFALVVALIGCQLMDWSSDSLTTPLKAYTLDVLQNEEKQVKSERNV